MRHWLPRVVGPMTLASVLALTELYELVALALALGVAALLACRAALHRMIPRRPREAAGAVERLSGRRS